MRRRKAPCPIMFGWQVHPFGPDGPTYVYVDLLGPRGLQVLHMAQPTGPGMRPIGLHHVVGSQRRYYA